ncbi:putative armadillo-like helical protein [Helianthus anomalus]
MECISLVGMAVRKRKNSETMLSRYVMEVLITLQGSQTETDNPTTRYMLQVGVNFWYS